MSDRLVISLSPELEELQRKTEELSALEADLVQGELDLATTHGELQNFEREYQQIIGTRYAELERIEIQIAEYMAYLESTRDFKPSEDIKQIYRQVAKLIHPDLTTDPQQKLVRQQLMMEANQAYEDGNIDRLREILRSWESRPEAVEGEGIGAELIRIIRKIAQCRERLRAIRKEIAEIEQTELYQLQVEVSTARENGKELLVEMARDLDKQIDKIPGMGKLSDGQLKQGEDKLKQAEAMIQSMTKEERANPDLLAKTPSRRRRIAKGCGCSDVDVGRLTGEFMRMRLMMQQMAMGNSPINMDKKPNRQPRKKRGWGTL